MIVRRAQRRDVAGPQFANIGQTAATPAEMRAAKALDQEVGNSRAWRPFPFGNGWMATRR